MSKYTKIIAAFGIAAGLGVASLPVAGSYAAEITDPTTGHSGGPVNGEVELQVTVSDYIKITIDNDVAAAADAIAATESTSMKSHVNVSTNSHNGYKLEIVSADADFATTGGALRIDGKTDARDAIAARQMPLDGTKLVAENGGGWNYTVRSADTTGDTDIVSITDGGGATTKLEGRAITGSNVIIREKDENTTADGEDTYVTYNVTAAADQNAGEYKGKVKYIATVKSGA